ncbi:MAG: hypothetical protein JW768_08665 [Chitinispirillaceae bacterium]|nr:hypothetical protein [Chitinispirillaceae bacterium]
MASINYGAREISVKIVYYGPGLSGKTTNLQVIHRKIPPDHKSDMVSLATEQDRTLFFDFLPLDLGTIKGFSTKFQLYTVPGQVYYNATRKLVLRGVDGVVFVADSGPDKTAENIESFQNLEDNLAEYHYKREEIPIVMQYNKRDVPGAIPIEEIDRQINKYQLPWTESVANKGIGVFDTLKLIGKIVVDNLNRKYSRLSRSAAGQRPAPQRTPAQQQYPYPPQAPQPQQRQHYQYQPQQQQQYQYPPQQSQYQYPPQQAPRQPVQTPPAPFPPSPGQEIRPGPQRQPSPPPQQPAGEGQSQFGFVNFEPVSPQQSPPRPAAPPPPPRSPQGFAAPASQQDAVTMEPPRSPLAIPSQDAAPSQETPPQPPDLQPRGNAHAVSYPQKNRPARTQIDERDYNVYHVDSSEATLPKAPFARNTLPVEDTDIRMQKKLNPQAGKQQKRFFSKFFNRDEE